MTSTSDAFIPELHALEAAYRFRQNLLEWEESPTLVTPVEDFNEVFECRDRGDDVRPSLADTSGKITQRCTVPDAHLRVDILELWRLHLGPLVDVMSERFKEHVKGYSHVCMSLPGIAPVNTGVRSSRVDNYQNVSLLCSIYYIRGKGLQIEFEIIFRAFNEA